MSDPLEFLNIMDNNSIILTSSKPEHVWKNTLSIPYLGPAFL